MQKIGILFGELVQFINPFIFLTLLLLGLSNVHDNEFEKKNVLAIVEWRSCCFKESSSEETGRWDPKHCSEVLNVYFIS